MNEHWTPDKLWTPADLAAAIGVDVDCVRGDDLDLSVDDDIDDATCSWFLTGSTNGWQLMLTIGSLNIEADVDADLADAVRRVRAAVAGFEQPIPLAKRHMGMRVDIDGSLGRLAEGLGRIAELVPGDDEAPSRDAIDQVVDILREDVLHRRDFVSMLVDHLHRCAEAYYAGNVAVCDQVFQLWCLDDKRPKGGDHG